MLLDAAIRGPPGTTCEEELKYVVLCLVRTVSELVFKVKELNTEVDRLDKEIQKHKKMQVNSEFNPLDRHPAQPREEEV